MSYPLINGAPINGDEAGGGDLSFTPDGLDLITGGVHTAAHVGVSVGVDVLEFGDLAVTFAAEFDGLDLITGGEHIGFHDIMFTPDGLDFIEHGVHSILVTPVAGGVDVLDFGALKLQIGVDINAGVPGLDLISPGLHIALIGNVPGTTTLIAGGVDVLSFGPVTVGLGSKVTTAGGADVLEIGTPDFGTALVAGGVDVLEIGGFGAPGYVTTAGGADVFEFGTPSVNMSFVPAGFDLIAHGTHKAVITGGFTALAGGVDVLEIGGLGVIGYRSITRAKDVLSFGTPSIGRGNTC